VNRYELDREATKGERALGASLVLVLAFFLGLASYYLWRLALSSWWLDPVILSLAIISAAGSLLLAGSLLRHLSKPPKLLAPNGLLVAAVVLVASGIAAVAFAIVSGLHTPRLYGPGLVSIAMGLGYIQKVRRL
jgi:hypothetical protein